ncbi:DUF4189 domain-containing protein [Moraxella equi]|uniref:DUF4189 domain-containing protein n=1 Tax=Moraxella equi TaxID=60442 RepID=A0A378QS06_9GAMM|nr:DUF4189 domain-containing protein [Moraxella equi]OPH37346.1 hypothetical protein B5J93_08245 [Moraxella equi]STZ03064.1 Uncharacterised protein [Moraxella equi]
MKILKLSATALIIGGANMLLSQSALACSPNLPNYGNCVRMQQQQAEQHAYQMHQQQSGGYGNMSSSGYSYGGVQHKYIGLAWTKDNKPFFDNSIMITLSDTPTENDWIIQDKLTLGQCEHSSRRSPCRMAYSMINGCIAIAKVGEMMYADGGASCDEAKQKAMQLCQAEDKSANACKIHTSKKS